MVESSALNQELLLLLNEKDLRYQQRALAQDDAIMSLRAFMDERDLRYDQRFKAQTEAVATAMTAAEKAVTAALIAADRAVMKAENASEKRFESVNEFRSSLNDMVAMMMPRTESNARYTTVSEKLDQRYAALDDKINTLMHRVDKSEGRSTYTDPALAEMSNTLTALLKAQSQSTGKGEGMSDTWKFIVSAIGLAATVLVIYSFAAKPAQLAQVQVPTPPIVIQVPSTTTPTTTTTTTPTAPAK